MKHLGLQTSNNTQLCLGPSQSPLYSERRCSSVAFKRFLQSYRVVQSACKAATGSSLKRSTHQLRCQNQAAATTDLQAAPSTTGSTSTSTGSVQTTVVHCNGVHRTVTAGHPHHTAHFTLAPADFKARAPKHEGSANCSNNGHIRSSGNNHASHQLNTVPTITLHTTPKPPQADKSEKRRVATVEEVHARHQQLLRRNGAQAAAAMLTTQLQLRTDWTELRDILVLMGHQLNHVHTVTMLCRLPHMLRGRPELWTSGSKSTPQVDYSSHPDLALLVRDLAARFKDNITELEPAAICGAACSLAHLGHYDSATIQQIQHSSIVWMPSLQPTPTVWLLWAVAWFHKHHQHPVNAQWLDTATFSTAASFPRLSSSQLARVLYATALLEHKPGGDWMQGFMSAFAPAISSFNRQDLSNSLYSLATLQLQLPPDILHSLDERLEQHIASGALQPRQLSNIVWAWGRLQHRPCNELMREVIHLSSPQLHRFGPQHLANLIWGLTTIQAPVSKGFQMRFWNAVRDHLKKQQRQDAGSRVPLCAQAFCSILWSFAVLGFRPPNKWLAVFFQSSADTLHRFQPRGLATTAWALGELGYLPNDEWMFDFRQAVMIALPACQPVDLVQLLCGFRGLTREFRYQPDSMLLEAVVRAAVAKLPSFTASQCAALLSASCVLYSKPSMRAMLAVLQQFDRQLHLANAHAVSNVVWAIGRLGSRSVDRPVVLADGPVLERLRQASQASLQSCNSVDLVQQVVGWGQLQYHPGAEWLQEHELQCCSHLQQSARCPPAPGAIGPDGVSMPSAAGQAGIVPKLSTGFTKREAEKLLSAYEALGHRVQHPMLLRLVQATSVPAGERHPHDAWPAERAPAGERMQQRRRPVLRRNGTVQGVKRMQ